MFGLVPLPEALFFDCFWFYPLARFSVVPARRAPPGISAMHPAAPGSEQPCKLAVLRSVYCTCTFRFSWRTL